MTYLRAFGRFLWSFAVGDDWRSAAALAALLAGTWVLTSHGLDVWWLLAGGVGALLAVSVWRAASTPA